MIERKLYKNIKSMNREEMDKFLRDLYREGSATSLEFDFLHLLSKTLKSTKGVGPKLYDKIMESGQEIIREEIKC